MACCELGDWTDLGVLCKLQQIIMAKQSRHDDIVVPTQHTSDVPGGFTFANLNGVRVKIHSMTPQPIEALQNRSQRRPIVEKLLVGLTCKMYMPATTPQGPLPVAGLTALGRVPLPQCMHDGMYAQL